MFHILITLLTLKEPGRGLYLLLLVLSYCLLLGILMDQKQGIAYILYYALVDLDRSINLE